MIMRLHEIYNECEFNSTHLSYFLQRPVNVSENLLMYLCGKFLTLNISLTNS